MTRLARLLRVGALLAALSALAAAFPMTAGAQQATLTGETFQSTTAEVSASCPGGALDATIDFQASGIAAGPFTGTFTEAGTFRSAGAGAFDATFTIVSGATTITGTKFAPPFPGGAPSGVRCNPPGFGAGFAQTVCYEAQISTPTGTFTDRGTAFVHVEDFRLPGQTQPTPTLEETFSSDPTACPRQGGDDDGADGEDDDDVEDDEDGR